MALSSSLSLPTMELGFNPITRDPNFMLRKTTSLKTFNYPARLTNHSLKKKKDFALMSKSMLTAEKMVDEPKSKGNSNYDAIVIGSGIGGLVAATQLAVKGAKVLVLEKYVIPGGSSGYYQRDGYTFDVGSSVMFGFSDKVSSLLCVAYCLLSRCQAVLINLIY